MNCRHAGADQTQRRSLPPAGRSNSAARPSLLTEGETCWKIASAARATLLIDAQEYFAVLRAALLQAQRSVLIAGWDFDTRTALPRSEGEGAAGSAAPLKLGELLGHLRQQRPGLEIHVLRWDHHPIYRRDREPDTQAQLERLGVRFHGDTAHPPTGCVHHKVVVIDDALAFCGGIDLTHHRWDSCRHAPRDPRRRDHHGKPYQATHDTQLCATGPIAQLLGEYVRSCWRLATGVVIEPVKAECMQEQEAWPSGLRTDFEQVRIAIARTVPAQAGQHAVREIEALYLRAIAATRRSLYLENQYFTSTRIARAIVRQCKREPRLQGLLIGCKRPRTWIEHQTMGYGRTRFSAALAADAAAARVPLVAALDRAGQGIIVHSKLGIFDDRLLTVGSANLNRRSMGFDVECNLVLEASDARARRALASVRNRLLAEHLDLRPQEAAAAVRVHGLAGLPRAIQRARRLMPLDGTEANDSAFGPMLMPFFDRDQPWPLPALPAAWPRWHTALLWVCFICYLMLSTGSEAH